MGRNGVRHRPDGDEETSFRVVAISFGLKLEFIFQQGLQEHHALTGEHPRGVRLRVTPAAKLYPARVLRFLAALPLD
jgi:hypothetical protein